MRPTADKPWQHMLYRFYRADDVLLYVGITNDVGVRCYQHATYQTWWAEVSVCQIEFFPTRSELEAAERVAIDDEAPLYNRTGANVTRLRKPKSERAVDTRPRTLHLDDEVWERLGGYAQRHRQSRSAAASIILTNACDDDELRAEKRVANG